MVQSSILARLRLVRVQTLALTALVPVIGALVFMGASPAGGVEGWEALPDLALLFVVGAMLHVFGFVLNEWADVEVDRASVDLRDKPLVSGEVSRKEALGIALGAAFLCFPPLALVSIDPLVHFGMLASLILGGIYDVYGKRMPLDLVLAGSLTLLLLTGAMASGAFDTGSFRHWTIFGCLGGLQFLQNLFQNAIEGGLKDADHDAHAGTRTFAAVLGVRVVDGQLVPTKPFMLSAVGIKVLQLALLAYTVLFLLELELDGEGILVLGWVAVMGCGMVVTLTRFAGRVPFDRSRLKRTFSVHEMATFAATVGAFLPLIGVVPSVLLLVFPVLWFIAFNTVLFSGALEPGV